MTSKVRALLIWAALVAAIAIPIAAALSSPLLAFREPVYVVAGLAGVVAMTILLMQPLLAVGALPGVPALPGRRIHRWTGTALVTAIVVHVGGLWITSPPDVLDALLFSSPTPFSVWGVFAMWTVFATAVVAVFRRRLRPPTWRLIHVSLAVVIVTGSVIHALLIEGTMETVSKVVLSALVLAATARVAVATFRRSVRRVR